MYSCRDESEPMVSCWSSDNSCDEAVAERLLQDSEGTQHATNLDTKN